MIRRRDIISFYKLVDEMIIAEDHISQRRYDVRILGVRQLLGGCWFASACSGCSDVAELSAELESVVKTADLEPCAVPESFDVEFYVGKLTLGSRGECLDATSTTSSMLGLLKEYQMPGCECTLTTRKLRVLRTIRAENSDEAYEEKNLIEIRVSVRHKERAPKVITLGRVVPQGFNKNIDSVAEELLRVARERAKAVSAARRPSLTEIGRAEVVLYREASPTFFHELSHLLAGARAREVIGKRLFDASSMKVYDSPGDLRRPTARFFDDEGVITRRRWLVEGGFVVDAHHSIRTAYETGSYPGSAHGLVGGVELIHTSLAVESGDWRDDELFEETKHGFVIDGAASALLEGEYIRLIPQSAYRLRQGDLGEPVHIKAVKIPITRPIKVLGIGRTSYTTYSYESEGDLVSETSPAVKIEAFIEA